MYGFELISQSSIAETMSFKQKSGYFSDSQLDDDQDFVALTRSEAQALEALTPKISLQSVLWFQLMFGVIVVIVSSFFSWLAAVSAFAGVVAAWLPSALFVWRINILTKQSFALTGFYLWEAMKILSTIALLTMVVLWIKPLVWQALLLGFVVTMKTYSIGCMLSLSKNKQVKS